MGQWGQTAPKSTPFPVSDVNPHSVHQCLGPPHSPVTTPNDSSIGSHTSAQLHNKFPIGYNGTPQIHPILPLPLRRSPPPSNTPIPRPTPLTIPNGIRIHSATFRTDRQTDRQTDRHTDRQMGYRRQVRNMSAALAMLIESDALIKDSI